MQIQFGRDSCGNLSSAEKREWLVTNGIGGYASGTVAGLLTRCYHGMLIAALQPPLGRTLLLAKLDETVLYDQHFYFLYTNRWADRTIDPHGYLQIESFGLEGTVPVWRFACADALVEKRIWMLQGMNTTYVHYTLHRATCPLTLTLKALVNYRDHHGRTQGKDWQMRIEPIEHGVAVIAFSGATPFYLLSNRGEVSTTHDWYYGFDLALERERGLNDCEDHLHAATFQATLRPGESFTFVASVHPNPSLEGKIALQQRQQQEQAFLQHWLTHCVPSASTPIPAWIQQLVLATTQFIVDRSVPDEPNGKTVIAGYHWFGDWGRDTMISLPGLTLTTGRTEIARSILRTFARYVDQGMLPNRFPDQGQSPEYNTVDATLWYFEALRLYMNATQDCALLEELFPVLADIISWHRHGTRYKIHLDPGDGLLYAGEPSVQLTWMDAKIAEWVVTPRTGKPIEINALWYSALRTMAQFARQLGKPDQDYTAIADQTRSSFNRFWNDGLGYCYDVLDGPEGNDGALRPNQIFAVSLPLAAGVDADPLLTRAQQQRIVEVCGRELLTSHGLRSLAPHHPDYRGYYGGNAYQRDSAYHQGTVWGWLLGPFVLAHWQAFQDANQALEFLQPMAHHLQAEGVGTLSEIFDGDVPMTPRGCIAQAWTVAEVLRAWTAIQPYLESGANLEC